MNNLAFLKELEELSGETYHHVTNSATVAQQVVR